MKLIDAKQSWRFQAMARLDGFTLRPCRCGCGHDAHHPMVNATPNGLPIPNYDKEFEPLIAIIKKLNIHQSVASAITTMYGTSGTPFFTTLTPGELFDAVLIGAELYEL